MAADPDSPERGRCPICRRASDARYRPFCSRRCADVDLSRWLRGSYAIPADGEDEVLGADLDPDEPPPHA
ncbi:MAG TPA: DNA gyrase inhibitor YacG [Hyphomicrobiaceae bacterium]|nr:DNA gyrase inhibitor YacG [Hyphomicrobiaceae bacterium]